MTERPDDLEKRLKEIEEGGPLVWQVAHRAIIPELIGLVRELQQQTKDEHWSRKFWEHVKWATEQEQHYLERIRELTIENERLDRVNDEIEPELRLARAVVKAAGTLLLGTILADGLEAAPTIGDCERLNLALRAYHAATAKASP